MKNGKQLCSKCQGVGVLKVLAPQMFRTCPVCALAEAFLFLTPTPTNDNTIPIKTTKDDDDEGSRNNA